MEISEGTAIAIVLGIVLGVPALYAYAWKSKGKRSGKTALWVLAIVSGFAGAFGFLWLISAFAPFPTTSELRTDWSNTDWRTLLLGTAGILLFFSFPAGACYLSVRFARMAMKKERGVVS